jgi:hypothetical protein
MLPKNSRLRPDRDDATSAKTETPLWLRLSSAHVKPPTRQSCRHAIAGGLLHRPRHHPGRRHEMLHLVNRRKVGTRLLTGMCRALDTAGLARS